MAKRTNGSGRQAGIYCRISKDAQAEGLGVTRQRDDCGRFCEQRGWVPVDVFVDNDLSAFSGKVRPEYTRLLEALKAGTVDAVVTWHPDRLHRSPRELEDFVDLVEATGAAVATVTAGDTDLATPEGRLVARITGAVARKESEDKSRRLRRKHEELAERGKFSGGGRRAYGFEAGGLAVRRDEAKHIRQAVGRVIAGESMGGIARDWNKRGILTPEGNEWRQAVVRKMLLSGRIAGLRTHEGQVVAEAEWPAIVDRATWERMKSVYGSRTYASNGGVNARKYLLPGFVFCGLCGSRLRSQNPRYHCPSQPGLGGCGRIHVHAKRLEELVTEMVFHAVDTPKLAERITAAHADDDTDNVAEMIARDEAALEELSRDFYVDNLITKNEFLAARRGLEQRLDEHRRKLAYDSRNTALEGFLNEGGALRKKWPTMTLDRQRAVLAAVIDRVVVNPSGVKGHFDPERVVIHWRA